MQKTNLLKVVTKFSWILPAITIMVALIFIVYPGGFSPDSFSMYAMATGARELTDIKPLFTILVMRLGINVFGDGGLVIINSTIYLIGVMLISAAIFTKWPSRLLVSLLLVLFPPLLMINLSNWIDGILLSALSASVGCILMYVYRSNKAYLLWGAAFFSVWSILARHNALSTMFFIQILIVHLLAQHYFSEKNHRLAVFFGFIFLFGGSLTINPLINKSLGVEHTAIWNYIYTYDLASISILEDKNLIPKGLLTKTYQDKSDEEVVSALKEVFIPHHAWKLGGIIRSDPRQEFMQYSIRTSLNYPGSLLFTRYRTNMAWLTKPYTAYILNTSPQRTSKFGVRAQNKGKVFLGFEKTINSIRDKTNLFHAGWYLLLAFTIFFIAFSSKIFFPNSQWFSKERVLLASFTLASIFTWLPLVPIINTAEFRYLTPIVFLVVISFLILFRYLYVYFESMRRQVRL
jgi:hypothetical protein